MHRYRVRSGSTSAVVRARSALRAAAVFARVFGLEADEVEPL